METIEVQNASMIEAGVLDPGAADHGLGPGTADHGLGPGAADHGLDSSQEGERRRGSIGSAQYDFDDHNSSDDEIDRRMRLQDESRSGEAEAEHMDILLTFVKGQKHMYGHCARVAKQKLNLLMIPCITISSVNTILSSFFNGTQWMNNLSSTLNTIILLLISMMSYFKFESTAESFGHLYRSYDKVEGALRLAHTRTHFYVEEGDLRAIIREFEKKIQEIKDAGAPIIPRETRAAFPVISQVHVSSLLRAMEVYRKQLFLRFADIRDEIRSALVDDGHDRLSDLYAKKEAVKKDIHGTSLVCVHMDTIFTREIRNASRRSMLLTMLCPHEPVVFRSLHPVIDEHLGFIFDDA